MSDCQPDRPPEKRRVHVSKRGKSASRTPASEPAGGSEAECLDSERSRFLTSLIEGNVIPQLMMLHKLGASGAPAPEVPAASFKTAAGERGGEARSRRITAKQITDLVGLVRGDTLAEGLLYCTALRERGYPLDRIFQDLLAPAARQLGTLWEEDEVDFLEVTVAVGRLQRIVCDLRGSQDVMDWSLQSALMTAPPGEQHTFGLHMAAEGLRSAGLDVVTLVADDLSDIEVAVRQKAYNFVGISVGSESLIGNVVSVIDTVRSTSRRNSVKVIVGGAVTTVSGSLRADLVGADCLARDVAEAVAFVMRCREERVAT
jgi:methanogenic corrinoid protein MtbC1